MNQFSDRIRTGRVAPEMGQRVVERPPTSRYRVAKLNLLVYSPIRWLYHLMAPQVCDLIFLGLRVLAFEAGSRLKILQLKCWPH